jgi:hypothetical protein
LEREGGREGYPPSVDIKFAAEIGNSTSDVSLLPTPYPSDYTANPLSSLLLLSRYILLIISPPSYSTVVF